MMKKPLVCLMTLLCAGAVAPSASFAVGKAATQSNVLKRIDESAPLWLRGIDDALAMASEEYKPALVLFTSQDCPWCVRLKTEVLANPALQDLLKHFSLAEIDISEHEELAAVYQVRGVPAIVIMSGDGRVRQTISGFVGATQLKSVLEQALNPKLVRQRQPAAAELLMMLGENKVPPDKWADIAMLLGSADDRRAVMDRILQLAPAPRQELAGLLDDKRLAVRLGALEALEELAGSSFGFDPWLDEPNDNASALVRWKEWAGRTNEPPGKAYSELTGEQVADYVRDLVSGDRDRSVRAMRILAQGGPAIRKALSAFLAEHPELTPANRRKIKEVEYAIIIPSGRGVDAHSLAHRLVFGTLDVRLESIAALQQMGARTAPILVEFLADADPLIRESAVEVLASARGAAAVLHLEERLKTEKDVDVIYAVLRALGQIRTRRSLNILTGYLSNPNEDLVVAALNSMARIKSKLAADKIGARLSDARWRVRVAALDAVAELKLSGMSEKVEQMLADPDEFARFKAVKCLSEIDAKGAVKKLEEAFVREDNLKAPIIEAFGSMDMKLPDSFAGNLEGKPQGVLLAVIQALEHCEDDGLRIAAKYLDDDGDLGCAAVRLIASKGGRKSEYQPALLNVLRKGNREKVLALLQSAGSDRYGEPGELEMLAMGAVSAAWKPGAGDSSQGTDTNLANLFAAFETGDAEKPAGNPAPTQEAPSLDDLFASFGESARPAPGAAPDGSPESFAAEVTKRLDPPNDEEIRFAAAMLLARMGNPAGLRVFNENWPGRTAADRLAIAQSLEKLPPADILPILQRLLRDPSEQVRECSAHFCMSKIGQDEFGDALFAELLREGTPLKAYEAYTYRSSIESALRRPSARRKLGDRLRGILSASKDPVLQNFALILMEQCWKESDEKTVLEFAQSVNPHQRRAALYTLAKNAPGTFRAQFSWMKKDPSELVRVLIPAFFSGESGRWIHYFDETHFEDSYEGISPEQRGALNDEDRALLLELTRDDSPKVRVESFFALLSRRVPVDLAEFVTTLDAFPDQKAVGERVASYLVSNYKELGDKFSILLPYLDNARQSDDYVESVRKHFQADEEAPAESLAYEIREGRREPIMAAFLESAAADAPSGPRVLRMIFFTSPGCRDCAKVERMLPSLRQCFPELKVDVYSMAKTGAKRINEALSEKFRVPDSARLVTPAVFAAAGYLTRNEIAFERLAELLARSGGVRDDKWHEVKDEQLAKADASMARRFHAAGLGLIVSAALIDGIGPCAFATIIFLLSYLQIARRSPIQIAAVGLAFIVGVFAGYLALGLGLAEIVSRLEILRRFGRIVSWVLAAFALVIAILSIRDGVLCLHGKLSRTTLQLPLFLKQQIHGVIRRGARQSRFVAAAFVMGIVIAVLELACTGQVLLPTIIYVLQTSTEKFEPMLKLIIYNFFFVVPLVVVFLFAYFGLTSEGLTRVLQKHAAAVKFATAALFLVLFLFFVFGDSLLPALQ